MEEVAGTDGAPLYQLTQKGELLLVHLMEWLDLQDSTQPPLHKPPGHGPAVVQN